MLPEKGVGPFRLHQSRDPGRPITTLVSSYKMQPTSCLDSSGNSFVLFFFWNIKNLRGLYLQIIILKLGILMKRRNKYTYNEMKINERKSKPSTCGVFLFYYLYIIYNILT